MNDDDGEREEALIKKNAFTKWQRTSVLLLMD